MPFFELLQNTDILITAGTLPSELTGCLPMSGNPYALSICNRPLLWHCLVPLVDAGGRNFFLCICQEWRSEILKCLDEFTAYHHLHSNLDDHREDNNNSNDNDDNKNKNNNKNQNQQQKRRSSFDTHTGTNNSNIVVADVNFFFVLIEENECRENQSISQLVHYARHHRTIDSIKDFMVVHFDTLLSPEVIRTFLQGFQTNFASSSVLFLERDPASPEDLESDFICVDDDISSSCNAAAAAGNFDSGAFSSMFAEHRRLHLSEPLPCDPEHDFRSSMLMRRPQMVFSKKFKQLPVYLFRPWVAQALVLHFEAASLHQQQAAAAQEQASSSSTTTGTTNNTTSKKQQHQQQQQQQPQEPFYQMLKFREEFIPSLLMCQYSSFIALSEDQQHHGSATNNKNSTNKKIRFRTVTSSERLMEELSIPASLNSGKFKIRPHWCLNAASSALLSTTAGSNNGNLHNNNNNNGVNNNTSNQQQQTNSTNNNNAMMSDDGASSSNASPTTQQRELGAAIMANNTTTPSMTPTTMTNNTNAASFLDGADASLLSDDFVQQHQANDGSTTGCNNCNNTNNANNNANNNNVMINGEQQQLVSSSFGGILLPTPSLEVLNAAGPSLAPPTDEIRVFATLVKRNTSVTNPSTNTTTVTCELPIVKRIDSTTAYDSVSAMIRDGLEIPPPPLVSSIQKYAVPDLHAMTYNTIVQNTNTADEILVAPKNFLRCGLLTLPPTPGFCRIERCVIGKNVKFGERSAVFDSVIMEGAVLGEGCVLRGCVVGPNTMVKDQSSYTGAILSGAREEYIVKTMQKK